MIKNVILILGAVFLFSCNSKQGNENNVENDSTEVVPKDELAILSEKITNDNKNADLYNERANAYMAKGFLDEAFADIRNAMLIDSSKAEYFETYADIQFALGLPSKTKAALHKAIKLNPEYVNAYLKLAELHLYYKEYKETFDFISDALKIDNKVPKAFFIKGIAFAEKGYKDRAIKSFQEVINIDPDYYKAYIELGFLFAKEGNQLAESYFKGALNIQPKSIEALYALGMFYQENGKPDEAISTYTMLLEVDSNYKFAHYNIGYVNLVIKEDFEAAIPFFEKAIALDSHYIQAYYNKAHCLELLGKYKEAESIYKEALKIDPHYDMAIDGLNRVQDKLYK